MLLSAVSGSMAISLGRSSGATLLGRPLDVTVRLELDSAETGAPYCVEAEVFYADDRITPSRVQASVERTASAADARIRIRVARPIDEPVVTLYVRAGCAQRTERRYVLLADVATEQAPAAGAVAPMSRSATDVLPQVAAPAAEAAPRVSAAVRATRERSRDAGPRPPPMLRASGPQAAQAPAKSSARLRLEPIDLTVESFPKLRASTQVLNLPPTSPEQRMQAAAMWKALSTQPEDIVAAAAKVSAIEADVRGLQIETRKNQAALVEVATALQLARDQRYANGLVYSLLAALVLALAGLAWVSRRLPLRGRPEAADRPWWRGNTPLETGWHSDLGPAASGYHTHDGHEVSRPAGVGDQPAKVSLGAAASGAGRRRAGSSRAMPLSRRDQTDFGLSMPHTPRSVKAEELFDVQHQAEFFISIGKEEQAISVLLDHIGGDVQASALIYLDLFKLYHRLKRKEDYSELGESFNLTFNARIPAFEAYATPGRDLESYAVTFAQIRATWCRPSVLTLMESLIFQRPGEQGELFDPEAFGELLVLYGIAREIIKSDEPLRDSLLDFDLPDNGMDTDPSAAGADLLTVAAEALPVIEDPLASPSGLAPALDIDLDVLDEVKPVAVPGGNLIDFEALSLDLPARPTVKSGRASRQ